MTDSFPRQQARTQRFTLGAPRNITVAPDGSRVAFLRAAGPEDALTSLWVMDASSGEETVVADPSALLAGDPSDLPPEERVRRERARESAAGITGYATDASHVVVAAALAGQLVVADLVTGASSIVPVPSAVIDPRPDPTGTRVAWTDGRRLWLVELDDPESARVLDRGSRPGGALGGGRVRGRRGDGPVPRVLVGAGRLGPPRDAGRRHARPALVDRGSGASRPGAHEGRLPRRGHPERRGHGLDPSARRLADRAGLGSRRPPLPGGGRVGRPRAAPRPASSGPAPHRGARGRHHVRCDRGAVDRPRRGMGRARVGDARAAGRRARGRLLGPGRSTTARGGWHARDPRRPPRPRRGPRRRRRHRLHRQPDRRRHGHLGVAVDGRAPRAADGRRRRPLRRRRGRHHRRAARQPR